VCAGSGEFFYRPSQPAWASSRSNIAAGIAEEAALIASRVHFAERKLISFNLSESMRRRLRFAIASRGASLLGQSDKD
jgi:hypothetical protein